MSRMAVSQALKRYRGNSDCKENSVHYMVSSSKPFPSAAQYMNCMHLFLIGKIRPFEIHRTNEDAREKLDLNVFVTAASSSIVGGKMIA